MDGPLRIVDIKAFPIPHLQHQHISRENYYFAENIFHKLHKKTFFGPDNKPLVPGFKAFMGSRILSNTLLVFKYYALLFSYPKILFLGNLKNINHYATKQIAQKVLWQSGT